MTRKAMTLMVLVLLAATVATAATAFAGTKHHCGSSVYSCQPNFGFDPVMQQVVAANNATTQAMLRLKMKLPPLRQRGVVVMVKPAGFSAHAMPAAPIMLPVRR